jgi:hypothetical protein
MQNHKAKTTRKTNALMEKKNNEKITTKEKMQDNAMLKKMLSLNHLFKTSL